MERKRKYSHKSTDERTDKNREHRLWMLAKKRNGADVARLQYTQARNKVKSLLRKAKRTFEREIAQQSKNQSKSILVPYET